MYILNLIKVWNESILIFLLRSKFIPVFKGDIIPKNFLHIGVFTLVFSFNRVPILCAGFLIRCFYLYSHKVNDFYAVFRYY